MKLTSAASALVLTCLLQGSSAFVTPSQQSCYIAPTTGTGRKWWSSSMAVEKDVDLSIPYDAAARLAYDEWRVKFNKGAFDAQRFENFKANYEIITVANVVAKKRLRENSSLQPTPLMTLNEYGDYSESEYLAAMSQNTSSSASSSGNVLETAVEGAKLQSEASSALKEAANALAEEEEALAKKLGLASVEELESALDTLEGIAEDGGAIDDNLAREARIRAAYMEWCRQFDKKQDETRFKVFEKNYLIMEEYAKSTDKEMTLNEFADWTKEEYDAMIAKKAAQVVESKERADAEAKAALKAKEEAKLAKEKADLEAEEKRMAREEAAAKAKLAAEAAAKAKKEAAEAQAKLDAEKAKAFREQAAQDAAAKVKAEEERKKQLEKERAERQKRLDQEKAAAEVQAIAAAKAAAEAEARRAAERRRIDEEAAQLARKKAKEAEEALARVKGSASVQVTKPIPPRTPPSKPTPVVSSVAAKRSSPPEKTPEPKSSPFSFFSGTSTAEVKKESSSTEKSFFSLFSSTESKPATTVQKQTPQSKPATSKPASTSSNPIKKVEIESTPKPFFNLFSKSEPSPKKPVPEPSREPEPASLSPPSFGSFNLFESPKAAPPKVEVSKKIETTSKPVDTSPLPSFSFFGKSEAPAKKAEPVPEETKLAPSAGSFSLFGFQKPSSSSKAEVTKEADAPKKDIKVPNRSGTINLFGTTPKPRPAAESSSKPAVRGSPTLNIFASSPKPKQPSSPVSEPDKAPTFSLFGGSSAVKAPSVPVKESKKPTVSLFGSRSTKATPPPVESPVETPKPSFSFFGSKSKLSASSQPETSAPSPKSVTQAPPKGVPQLSRWKQNPDGSITGNISGSVNFRSGEKITTSPIKGKAAAGNVVVTGSGSRYYLQ